MGERILRLPGLKHSPDLMERIKSESSPFTSPSISLLLSSDLSPRVSAIPFPLDTISHNVTDYDIPLVLDPPVLEGISIDMDPPLFETLQLLLLSLPVGENPPPPPLLFSRCRLFIRCRYETQIAIAAQIHKRHLKQSLFISSR